MPSLLHARAAAGRMVGRSAAPASAVRRNLALRHSDECSEEESNATVIPTERSEWRNLAFAA